MCGYGCVYVCVHTHVECVFVLINLFIYLLGSDFTWCVLHVNVYLTCSSEHAASVKLMFVGLSGRGKTTLLYHLKYRTSKSITFRERLSNDNYTGNNN